MNFLGHLFFSNNDLELMYANLFGDHVKGSHLESFPLIIRQGVLLHRSIDSYMDHHPKVTSLMHELYPELPKVTGIAMDLFFDHLLAKNWNTYHPIDLEVYLDRFYKYEPDSWEDYSQEFREFIRQMREYRWMNYYPRFLGLEKACEGVSSRISFKNKLPDAPKVFLRHYDKIQNCFEEYMLDAVPYFESLSLPSTSP